MLVEEKPQNSQKHSIQLFVLNSANNKNLLCKTKPVACAKIPQQWSDFMRLDHWKKYTDGHVPYNIN